MMESRCIFSGLLMIGLFFLSCASTQKSKLKGSDYRKVESFFKSYYGDQEASEDFNKLVNEMEKTQPPLSLIRKRNKFKKYLLQQNMISNLAKKFDGIVRNYQKEYNTKAFLGNICYPNEADHFIHLMYFLTLNKIKKGGSEPYFPSYIKINDKTIDLTLTQEVKEFDQEEFGILNRGPEIYLKLTQLVLILADNSILSIDKPCENGHFSQVDLQDYIQNAAKTSISYLMNSLVDYLKLRYFLFSGEKDLIKYDLGSLWKDLEQKLKSEKNPLLKDHAMEVFANFFDIPEDAIKKFPPPPERSTSFHPLKEVLVFAYTDLLASTERTRGYLASLRGFNEDLDKMLEDNSEVEESEVNTKVKNGNALLNHAFLSSFQFKFIKKYQSFLVYIDENKAVRKDLFEGNRNPDIDVKTENLFLLGIGDLFDKAQGELNSVEINLEDIDFEQKKLAAKLKLFRKLNESL